MTLEDENRVTLTDASDGSISYESPIPLMYRMACYPDGRKLMQAGYAWENGSTGGLNWRLLPIVNVDKNGLEIPA